jgi:peptidylprolyl isomerase
MSQNTGDRKGTITGTVLFCLAVLLLSSAMISAGCTNQKQVVKPNDTVKVHYTVALASDGKVFESSSGGAPLEFVVGAGQMIPGFDSAVIGMSPGENKTVTVPAAQAYGVKKPELVNTLPRDKVLATLPKDVQQNWTPKVGDAIRYQRPDGAIGTVFVTGVNETTITIDENHPLAGQDLIFTIQLVEIVKK